MKPSWIFDPDDDDKDPANSRQGIEKAGGDSDDGRIYVYHDPKIALAINVAIVTGRPER